MTVSYDSYKLVIYCTASCLNNNFGNIVRELAFLQNHLKQLKWSCRFLRPRRFRLRI